MLVTFDFDCTLARPFVQSYAKKLIELDIPVGIITSRRNKPWSDHGLYINPPDNSDLYAVAEMLGIKDSNITFTNYENKHPFVKRIGPIIHLDDDPYELELINQKTKTRGISVWNNTSWVRKCDKILKIEGILCGT